jgi:phosphinothricin acetyltransferase
VPPAGSNPTLERLTIRPLEPSDFPAVLDLYNHYVEHSHCTFDTEAFSLDARRPWFTQFKADRYQCVVAIDNDNLVGYACSTPFKIKPAYQSSVEVSIYTSPSIHRRGAASALYVSLFEGLGITGLHRAYAGIALPNPDSVKLHEKFGFQQVGQFREVGFKFGHYWDVAWFEKSLPP